jgi:hypothetical protein
MLRPLLIAIAMLNSITIALAQTAPPIPAGNAFCQLNFANTFTASTSANAGTATVTGYDPNGLSNITISQDSTVLQTCAAPSPGTANVTCTANTSWTSTNTPHSITAVCTSISTMKQTGVVTYPN